MNKTQILPLNIKFLVKPLPCMMLKGMFDIVDTHRLPTDSAISQHTSDVVMTPKVHINTQYYEI